MIESDNNDRHFGRIWGAISLPESKSGCIVIVGEEGPGYRPANPAPIFWLTEHSSNSPTELLEAAVSLKARYMVSEFVGRLTDSQTYILIEFNSKAIDARKSTLAISSPPFVDPKGLFQFHLNCLRDRLRATSKSVFLGKSNLAARLTEIAQAEVGTARDFDFPEVSALCYAVAALTVTQPSSRRPPKVVTDFDPFNYDKQPNVIAGMQWN